MKFQQALLATVFCGTTAMFAPGLALAAEGNDAQVEQVVVTGSRIQTAGFQAPTPVTVVTAAQLTAITPGSIAETIAELPSMKFVGPQDTRSGTQAGSGGAYLNLRGLQSVRTLTLLDGRRVVGSTSSGTVDANLIPTALLERVDIVTGGASAAYGSDAVAGVVNFILNKKFNGYQFDAQYGQTNYGDGIESKMNGAYGTGFAGGRGHIEVSGELFKAKGIDCLCHRPVTRDSYSIILNPTYTATNGQFRRILAKDVANAQESYTGLITTGPFANQVFSLDGLSTKTVNYGLKSGSSSSGGDPLLPRASDFTILTAPNEHANTFLRTSWDLTDRINIFAEGILSYTKVYFSNGNSDSQGTSALIIQKDNAYLPASLAAAMAAQNQASFRLGRSYSDLPSKDTYQRNWTQRYMTGANIDLGGTWKGEVYAEYGLARNSSKVEHNLNQNRMFLAMDAVRAPNGQIVCRSTLTNPTNGCVPYDPFGFNTASDAAKQWLVGESNSLARIQQNVVSASVNGQPFSDWAGPVSFAFGAEYRHDKYKASADAVSTAINSFTGTVGGWRNANPQPQSGAVSVKEAFAETDVPLLTKAPLAEELDLNAAVRLTDYSTSGTVTSWKVGLQWKPLSDLRFRATRSRDIRAPTINELFLGGQQTFATILDPVTNTSVGNVRQITRGNPNLKPESADTTTIGVVFQPQIVRGFTASIDLYNIDISGAIASQTAQQTVNSCAAGSADACAAVLRTSTKALTEIDLYPRNLASLKTSGVDVELLYRVPMEDLFALPGNLSLSARGTYVSTYTQTSPGAAPLELAGDVGTTQGAALPRVRWNAGANYTLNKWTLNLQSRYVGGGRLDSGVPSNDIDVFRVKGRTYFDGRLAYEFREGAEAFIGAQNLFNRLPPTPTNTTLYDSIGRMVRVGFRLKG